jgi:hypothetical protein
MDGPRPTSRPPSSFDRKFSSTHKVGRLVEAWALQFDTIHDVAMFGVQSTRAIAEVSGPVVICSDYSNLQAFPSDVFPAFIEILKRANLRLERAALIMPRQGTALRGQMEGLLRHANHPNRRLCADPADAKAWLSSLLTREEQVRLDQFLKERELLDPALVAYLRRRAPVVPVGLSNAPGSEGRRPKS